MSGGVTDMAAVKKAKIDKGEGVQKVSMNLTPLDLENIEFLKERLNLRASVDSVTQAMKLARQLLELIDEGDRKMIMEDAEGNRETIKFRI